MNTSLSNVSDANKAFIARRETLSKVVRFESIVGCVLASVFGIYSLFVAWSAPLWGVLCFVYALIFLLFGVVGVNSCSCPCLLTYLVAGVVGVAFCIWIFISATIDLVFTIVDQNSSYYLGASYGFYIFLLVVEMIATLAGSIFYGTAVCNAGLLRSMLRTALPRKSAHKQNDVPPVVVVDVRPPNIQKGDIQTYEQPPPSYSEVIYRI